MTTKEHILVTGGAGFIGSHTVDKLLNQGHSVTVIDNFSNGKRENLKHASSFESFQVLEGELQKSMWSLFHKATESFGKIDRIVHFAAQIATFHSVQNPTFDVEINYTAIYDILEYSRQNKVKKVIYASSAATYGDLDEDIIHEELPKRPMSPYGIDKYASEMAMRYYSNVHGVSTVPLRFFNVFGPRQDPRSPYSGVISIFVERALTNKDITIFGDGNQTRDFVYIHDLVQGIEKALFGEVIDGTGINLGTGKATTINEFVQLLLEITQSEAKLTHGPKREGDIYHSCSSIERAKKLLNYSPNYTFKQGLEETIQWLQGN